MARITVAVDPALLKQAKEALGVRTNAAAIRIALTEVLRAKRRAAALAHQGRIRLDLDQETLRRLREEGQVSWWASL
ncbi:MAG: type II toxin-antitoxin system VapB family antitoxin [bacterium]|nr:type II toxin-antitoxin system VapB family antitoxin [bacterium]